MKSYVNNVLLKRGHYSLYLSKFAIKSSFSSNIETNSFDIEVILIYKGIMSSDKGIMSSDKGIMSVNKGAMSSDKGAMSSDKGVMSVDKGALLDEKGAKIAKKAVKREINAQKILDFGFLKK